jgi:hypothetical protein
MEMEKVAPKLRVVRKAHYVEMQPQELLALVARVLVVHMAEEAEVVDILAEEEA